MISFITIDLLLKMISKCVSDYRRKVGQTSEIHGRIKLPLLTTMNNSRDVRCERFKNLGPFSLV